MAKFCTNCGNELKEGADICLNCGKIVNEKSEAEKTEPKATNPNAKSKIAAGILGILLGSLGVHNFYLGYTGKAVGQLLLTLVGWVICIGPAIASIWGLVEGIMILTGSIDKDASGRKLVD